MAASRGVQWIRRADTAAFSPAPGMRVQPIVGHALMTCWISMNPGAVVVEHQHVNEQIGVVVEGSLQITIDGETRAAMVGDAYVVPPHVVHSGGVRAGLAGRLCGVNYLRLDHNRVICQNPPIRLPLVRCLPYSLPTAIVRGPYVNV
jgi:quercetin dioxygenase-like cupin family protein